MKFRQAFIVPKKALNLLKSALPSDEEVTFSFNKANAFFSFGNVKLLCRLIDAKYPDYNAVIPVDNPNLLTLSKIRFSKFFEKNCDLRQQNNQPGDFEYQRRKPYGICARS